MEDRIYANKESLEQEYIQADTSGLKWIPKHLGPEYTLNNVAIRESVEENSRPEDVVNFAKAFNMFCEGKKMEGVECPQVLSFELFQSYYNLLTPDKSNMGEILQALWDEYTGGD